MNLKTAFGSFLILCSLTACEEALQEQAREVIQELNENSELCDIDQTKLHSDLRRSEARVLRIMTEAARAYEGVNLRLANQDIQLLYNQSADINPNCSLSDLALRFNPGASSLIMYINHQINKTGAAQISADKIWIEQTSSKGAALYKLNQAPSLFEEKGSRIALFYFNAGDRETGLTLETLDRSLS
jgi:hypothetical protein